MKSSSRSRSKQAVTYMQVYGANRVLYRVTASNTHLIQKQVQPYQVYNAALRQLSLEVPFLQNGSILGS